jgi:hypothetical protein
MKAWFKIVCILLLSANLAHAEDNKTNKEPQAKVERVGGNYTVSSITRTPEDTFVVIFKSVKPGERFTTLRLESDHVHVAVKEGETLRLSAEILQEKGDQAEVSQVLLFLPNIRGTTPVWLLSRKTPVGELRGSRYLEMHAPLSDYHIL